jgi:hypothetical protein
MQAPLTILYLPLFTEPYCNKLNCYVIIIIVITIMQEKPRQSQPMSPSRGIWLMTNHAAYDNVNQAKGFIRMTFEK